MLGRVVMSIVPLIGLQHTRNRQDERTMVSPVLPTAGVLHTLSMTRQHIPERSVPTFCRICEAACGLLADLDASGQPVRLRPDRQHPVSQGFVCAKGTEFLEVAEHPARLLWPLRRRADGEYE